MFLLESKNKLKNGAGKNGNSEKESGKAQAFDFIHVIAEKNKKTGSCADGKSGKGRAESDGAFGIKLGDYNGGSAVRDKSDDSGNKRLEKSFACDELGKSFFADGFDAKFKSEHYNKDESESFCGVKKGAFKKSVMSFGVAMGMFFGNNVKFLFGDVEKAGFVNNKTRNDCKKNF